MKYSCVRLYCVVHKKFYVIEPTQRGWRTSKKKKKACGCLDLKSYECVWAIEKFQEWDNEKNSIHKMEFNTLHNSAHIIWKIHLQISTICSMHGKSINSHKIFTAKPHEKIPLRTLVLDVEKLHLIPQKHILKKYTILKWFKKRSNGHICYHDSLCVLQMQGISWYAEWQS